MTLERGARGRRRLGGWSGVTAASLLALAYAGSASHAQAQGASPPSPGAMLGRAVSAGATQSAVLVDVSVVEDSPTQSHVLLTFSTHAPAFSVIKSDGDRPAIAFANSARASSARVASGKGVIRSVNFQQQGPILLLSLETASAVTMTATPVGDLVVKLTVVSDKSASAVASQGGLPKAEERPPGEDGFEVVPLKYADISEVVGLLTDGQTVRSNDVFIPTEPAFGSAGVNGSPNAPAPVQNPTALDQPLAQSVDAAISVDRRLNAIILKGSPEAIARLKAKIAEIDVPVQSVILETMFVELDESGATNVGFNFDNSSSQIGVATLTAGSFSTTNATIGHPQAGISLQAAIYAQVQKGHGRIVSKPRIAAQSGSTAKIITGDALPILTSIALSGVNAVSQQVQYVNVGVTLQIAPRVSSTGFVTSHVFCVVSSVTGTSQGYPTISQREAETSATVRDGETFVIGGLTVESDLVTDSKVPGLGDVPLLGEAFKVKNGTRSKTDLYIVVTPTIIKRGDYALISATGGAEAARPDAGRPPTAQTADPQPAPPPQTDESAREPQPQADSAEAAGSAATAIRPAAASLSHPAVAGHSVQIGAFATASMARAALVDAAATLPDELSGKIRKVETATKGGAKLFRASIGGFETHEDAASFCAAMTAHGKPCFVSVGQQRGSRRGLSMRPKLRGTSG